MPRGSAAVTFTLRQHGNVIARSKATKQSEDEIPRFTRNDRKREYFTEFTLNEVNVFAMTVGKPFSNL